MATKNIITVDIMSNAMTVTFDFGKMLKKITGKNWEKANGPDSHCGIDYWYRSGKSIAYINIDQNQMTISIDGDTIFSGNYEDYPKIKELIA